MQKVDTFTATIYCGTKPGYDEAMRNTFHAFQFCKKYCDEVGLCVTITDTEFIYTNGSENGIMVGLINYPRFPSTPEDIKEHAVKIGQNLLRIMQQERLSIVCSDETIMLEKETRDHEKEVSEILQAEEA